MKWNKPTAAVADITTFSADYYPKQATKHTLPPTGRCSSGRSSCGWCSSGWGKSSGRIG